MNTHQSIVAGFVCILNDWLTDYEMDLIRNYNATLAHARSCAPHIFCDANMAMMTAFEDITDCKFDIDNREHVDLFSASWDYARINHLTEKA